MQTDCPEYIEGCAQSPRVNVLPMYASAEPVLSQPKGRFFARLASEIFLSSLQLRRFFAYVWGGSRVKVSGFALLGRQH